MSNGWFILPTVFFSSYFFTSGRQTRHVFNMSLNGNLSGYIFFYSVYSCIAWLLCVLMHMHGTFLF